MSQIPEQLSSRLKGTVLARGAASVGIADLTQALAAQSRGPVHAIAFALRYPDDAVDDLPGDAGLVEAIAQLGSSAKDIYASIGMTLRQADSGAICCGVDKLAEEFGPLETPLSQKAVAQQAGLGGIGKSSLLVTPALGPRVRLGTVFTNVALAPDAPYPGNECGRCRVCAEACPAHAVTEEAVEFEGALGFRIDRTPCEAHLHRDEEAHTAAVRLHTGGNDDASGTTRSANCSRSDPAHGGGHRRRWRGRKGGER